MHRIEVKVREQATDIIQISQTYGVINEDTDVHVNGAVAVIGKDLGDYKKIKVYANLCNKEGEILYILNGWKNHKLEENGYFSFSMYCSTVNRFFGIEEFSYAEIYVVFNEKDS